MNKLLLIFFFFVRGLSLPAQTNEVYANGLVIAYQTFGRLGDPVVILIMDTGAQMTDWPVDLCRKIADGGFRVIRFDNRDEGLSSRLDTLGQPDWVKVTPYINTCGPAPLPYTLLDMAKDVVGLMNSLRIRSAHIVGSSMGGSIAQLVAINFPDRVLSLTSIGATSGNPNRAVGDPKALRIMSAAAPTTNNKDSIINYLVSNYKAQASTDDVSVLTQRATVNAGRAWHPDGTARQVAAIFMADNCDRRPQLGMLKLPSLIIHGDKDPIIPVAAGKEVAAAIPNSTWLLIPGMGHDLSTRFVDALSKAMVDHFRMAVQKR